MLFISAGLGAIKRRQRHCTQYGQQKTVAANDLHKQNAGISSKTKPKHTHRQTQEAATLAFTNNQSASRSRGLSTAGAERDEKLVMDSIFSFFVFFF